MSGRIEREKRENLRIEMIKKPSAMKSSLLLPLTATSRSASRMQSALRTATTSARPITRLNGATVSRFLSTSRLLSSPLKSSTPSSATCPSCHVPLSPSQLSPLCPSCSTLVPPPPSTTTHYSLFSLPTPSYAIDLKALKREFLKLQQKVHPDRFGGQGEREEWAKLWSSRVNEAWKTLSNERERAEYLVSLALFFCGELSLLRLKGELTEKSRSVSLCDFSVIAP